MVLVTGVGRVVTILPNKMIGVIGEHAEYPIERLGTLLAICMCSFILFDSTGFMLYWLIACLLWQCMLSVKPTPAHKCVDRSSVVSAAFSHDKTTLGSASHDNTVKVRVCTRLFHENRGIIMSCHAAVFVQDDATLV